MIEAGLKDLGLSYVRGRDLLGLLPDCAPIQTQGPDYLVRNEPDDAASIALMNVTRLEYALLTEPRNSTRHCRILVAITAERIIAHLSNAVAGKTKPPLKLVN